MSDNPGSIRRPHAALDLAGRREKALKIERLLGLAATDEPRRLLEVGTGSGAIAQYFAKHRSLSFEVTGVDVVDQRVVTDQYQFRLVDGTALPFPDESFNVVLSDHVIEHVGDRDAQLHHLTEMRWVKASGATGYLAVPNRWALVEPHYRLAFLSWVPRSLRSTYLRSCAETDRMTVSP